MTRAAAAGFLSLLLFAGTGPLLHRAPGAGADAARVDWAPGRGGLVIGTLRIDGARIPAAPFGTEILLAPGDHRLEMTLVRTERFWRGLEWDTLRTGVTVEAGRRYRLSWNRALRKAGYFKEAWLEPCDAAVSGPQSASGTGITESRPMRTSAKSL